MVGRGTSEGGLDRRELSSDRGARARRSVLDGNIALDAVREAVHAATICDSQPRGQASLLLGEDSGLVDAPGRRVVRVKGNSAFWIHG